MKDYDRQILQILSEVGERGLSVRALAKHVYNLNCTLFAVPDIAEIHAYVSQYLQRNARPATAIVERMGKRGYYRLNPKSAVVRQMLLEFREPDEPACEKDDEKPRQDFSLSLFD